MTENPDYPVIFLEAFILSQCLFSIIYLSSFRWERNKWLVLAFFSIGMSVFGLLGSEYRFEFFVNKAFNNPSYFLLAFPSIYFYTASLVGQRTISNWKNLIHFVPFLIFFGIFLTTTLPPPEEIIFNSDTEPVVRLFFSALVIIPVIYARFIFRLIKKNRQKYLNEYSQSNIYITLNWIKWTVIILIALIFVFLIVMTVRQLMTPESVFFSAQFCVLLTCYALSFFSFRQPTLYPNSGKISNEDQSDESKTGSASKYNKIISEEEKSELINRLDAFVKNEKPYLNPKIRMPELAASLNLSPNVFSYLINDFYKMNFFTFINQHRVQYALELLKKGEYEKYTLEALGKMSGFNSKSTFNSRFKEFTGKSPKEFREGK